MYKVTLMIDGERKTLSEIDCTIGDYFAKFPEATIDRLQAYNFESSNKRRMGLILRYQSADYPILHEIETLMVFDDQVSIVVDREEPPAEDDK